MEVQAAAPRHVAEPAATIAPQGAAVDSAKAVSAGVTGPAEKAAKEVVSGGGAPANVPRELAHAEPAEATSSAPRAADEATVDRGAGLVKEDAPAGVSEVEGVVGRRFPSLNLPPDTFFVCFVVGFVFASLGVFVAGSARPVP